MNSEQQWISTGSMNRFYDHCYLIECAYYIISRYCCSFTNLLTHDDGSIPYYLVQKVKIAVEYGKILLNSRYRPFQHHLRVLGTYDYIDLQQYENLCILWNTIKAETQIVEMYFNQISLLIYPVVSSTTLPFLESIEHEDVSALIKINAIIHNLIGYDEASFPSTISHSPSTISFQKNVSRLLKSNPTPNYFDEEALGMFIVNNIIEPLFEDEEEEEEEEEEDSIDVPKKTQFFFKENDSVFEQRVDETVLCSRPTNDVLRCVSPEISNLLFSNSNVGVTPNSVSQLQLLNSNIFSNGFEDLFPITNNELFNNVFTNSKPAMSKNYTDGKGETKKYASRGDNFRAVRRNGQKRFIYPQQRKYQTKKNYEKKYLCGNYEFVNRKVVEYLPNNKNFV